MKLLIGLVGGMAAALTISLGPGQLLQGGQTADEQAVIDLEYQWAAAYVKGDATKLDSIFGPGYVQTNTRGKVTSKSEELADLRSGRFRYEKFETTDIKVQLYGDAAVVTGLISAKGTDSESGKTVEGQMRMTDTFVRESGKWQVVASQTTLVPSDSATSAAKPASHPSKHR